LVMQLPQDRAERACEAVAQGVDTIIFGPVADKRQASDIAGWAKAAGGAPCGAWLGPTAARGVAAIKDAGIDYVILSLDAAAAAVLDEGLGYVLALEEGVPDTLLRALDSLPLEAVTVALGTGPLTLRRQLELSRLAGLSRLPLFLRLGEEPTPQELESLRDVGAVAVLVDGEHQEAWSMLAGLRRAIDGLPTRRRRREERLEATLPRQEAGMAKGEEEEEEFE
ncbi:MAG: hypothetical protein ACE5IZ_09680, partial [Dehalococcoidia bacterium]